MQALVANEAPTTPVVNVESSRISFGQFLLRAVLAAVLIGGAFLGALAGADALGLFPKAAATSTGPSAGVESTVNYKWTEILGPSGTKLYTQCSSTEPGTRVFMSQGGDFEFRADKNCK